MSGAKDRKVRMVATGHNWLPVAAMRIVVPKRKGSVLLPLMRISMMVWALLKDTSDRRRWRDGSNFEGLGQVYSEILSKPKNAIKQDARNMYLSGAENKDADKNLEIAERCLIVIGCLGGRVKEFPWVRLMPLRT